MPIATLLFKHLQQAELLLYVLDRIASMDGSVYREQNPCVVEYTSQLLLAAYIEILVDSLIYCERQTQSENGAKVASKDTQFQSG